MPQAWRGPCASALRAQVLPPRMDGCCSCEWARCPRRALAQDEQLRKVPVSIDTFQAEVARQAVQAGASIVNDISGGGIDPDMHAQVWSSVKGRGMPGRAQRVPCAAQGAAAARQLAAISNNVRATVGQLQGLCKHASPAPDLHASPAPAQLTLVLPGTLSASLCGSETALHHVVQPSGAATSSNAGGGGGGSWDSGSWGVTRPSLILRVRPRRWLSWVCPTWPATSGGTPAPCSSPTTWCTAACAPTWAASWAPPARPPATRGSPPGA